MQIQMTKLEQKRAENKLRAERESNIKELEDQLKHAEGVLAVIPVAKQGDTADKEAELTYERKIVSSTINELSDMLEDEKEALENIEIDSQTDSTDNHTFNEKEL